MHTLFKQILLWSCTVLFASCNPSSSVNIIPTSRFFKEFQNKAYHLSPDGAYISYLRSQGDVSNIFVENMSSSKVTPITHFKLGGVKSYFWANSNSLFYIAYTVLGQELYYASTDGLTTRKVLLAKKIDFIENKLWNKKCFLLAIQNKGKTSQNAYSMDICTWKTKLIGLNPGNIIKWKSDNEGKIRLAVASDGLNETILFRDTEKGSFKPLINSNFINTITPIKFTHINNSFYALSNIGTDNTSLVTINCENGSESGVIKHSADVVDVTFKNNMPAQVETSKKKILFINKDWETIYFQLKSILKTPYLKILENDESGHIYLLKRYSDVHEDAFYVYNNLNNSLVDLSEKNTVPASKLCSMKPIYFTNRDGLVLEGYLTLPKGDKYNLPCVILPHAALHGRDEWGYVPEVQFLANRGYAVLQINYRGSCGYGKAFKIAGFKNWATLMQNDIADGAKWLRDTKIANPKKIAIFGYGFGGFCALNGALNYPDIYACAASYSGINNLFSYMKDYTIYGKPYQQMLNQTIGNPVKDASYLRQVSPIFNVNKFKIPLYIVQGAKDKLVSVNETNQFVKDIRKRNVEVKYLLKETEGHTFVDNKNTIELYNKLDTFLMRNIH